MKTTEILKALKTNELILHSTIALGYTPGLPMADCRNGVPCLVIPYMKYQMTGKVDATLVFVPRYVVTVEVKHGTVVDYSDLTFDNRFSKVDFNKPAGNFRHAAIHHLDKREYEDMRNKLYEALDTLCKSMTKESDFDEMDKHRMAKLYDLLLEPSVKPFYHAIDRKFFETYISHD